MHIESLKLCLLTHPTKQSFADYCTFILSAIRGGVTSIQLRHKGASSAVTHALAEALITLLRPLHIPLIINDDVTLAHAIDADGVHLGQSDCTPEYARSILGPNKIIGLSIETLHQLNQANTCNALSYVAASAVFPTQTKHNCKTIWGLDGLKHMVQHSVHPVVAIGGINSHNIRQIAECGAIGSAVISAIHDAINPERAAYDLIHAINPRGVHV